MTEEQKRLDINDEKDVPLEKWGPYLSERQWGTVREDYSKNGDAWSYFPHDHARSRVYRWGEDGLAGISDYFQNLCFGIGLWNGKDAILKERLYGVNNNEGNHAEDVKELYYHMDNVPTHYYMEFLYKYPQAAFPYTQLLEGNRKRSKQDPEYELLDTGVFDEGKYFDVLISYAKEGPEDIVIKINITNHADEPAPVTVLGNLWFYNRWWYGGLTKMPLIEYVNTSTVKATHERIGTYYLYFQQADDLLFTENETNTERVTGKPNVSPFVKDAFHDAIIENENVEALRNRKNGTKCAPIFRRTVPAKGSVDIFMRLTSTELEQPFQQHFEHIFDKRKKEADEFYKSIAPANVTADRANIQRKAFAGMLWSKQYYHLDVTRWLNTDDGITPQSESRKNGRNSSWKYLKNQDIILMPDKWEYPWYAVWDLAFHCVTMAMIDPVFAKHQLVLVMREWYMNPEGQIPAYEWNFNDVNPPVHAWAALQVYKIEKKRKGKGDVDFLKRIFQKLLINFTWWTNRKDVNGNNIFEGGFLGMDNIGVFNRSMELPAEITLEQADGTSWMGFYALKMLEIASEISLTDISFEDTATRFFEHFIFIAEALNELGLWNNSDEFFYDTLCVEGKPPLQMQIRSLVGLTPLFAVAVIKKKHMDHMPDFKKRIAWFENYRVKNGQFWPNQEMDTSDGDAKMITSLLPRDRLVLLLKTLFDESEFFSVGGIRSVSKFHREQPYTVNIEGEYYSIQYDPGDSTSSMFGGNSNWRGPVWMPINYLIVKALKKYHQYYGDQILVECPNGSGKHINLFDAATILQNRLIGLLEKDKDGNRKYNGIYQDFYNRPENKDLLLFYEYFHGDTGSGLGASHQTGWTALVANLIDNQ